MRDREQLDSFDTDVVGVSEAAAYPQWMLSPLESDYSKQLRMTYLASVQSLETDLR
jgi:hypothetical protein